MGIRLDWEIEAEQTHVKRAGEEPVSARKRRLARFRFLLFILIVLGVFSAIVGLVVWRLQAIEAEVEQALRYTVETEVASLRLGDFTAFSTIQRSASDEWLQAQTQVFNQYQDLKFKNTIVLSGQILDLKVDRTRARVTVQEIIDGVPYAQLWFYWRYDDGWRHVPPDYTFWGELRTDTRQDFTVRYQDVDAQLAAAMSEQLPGWLQFGCSVFQCTAVPPLTIEIIPDETVSASSVSNDPWQLQIPSPYITRARADTPFDLDTRFAVANLLAERFVARAIGDVQPQFPADAYYLRQAVVSWLVGRFVQVGTNSFLVDSLSSSYGDTIVGALVTSLRPDSSVAVISQITGMPLESLALDWRDFFTWRLVLEDQLLTNQDETGFLSLYDTLDEAARNLAYQRFQAAPTSLPKTVTSIRSEVAADGSTILVAIAQADDGGLTVQQEVSFRAVDGVWKRLN